ncbi:MAG: LysM peptidoglycan-binding domain-containing protein [Verrucomicrobiae bacterium]|nr:LysM peptidoglycan-binding domain-containing protein [Verrucomicrobiae bacterium]MCX7722732.1 LysM peptidoglycan-binding domain-containing protein [Verrucomicrobiae bacterium]MDW7981133.1 LysM peptidoglycan-binding domain-containing protein [Verrucomicrobiales bacterium]
MNESSFDSKVTEKMDARNEARARLRLAAFIVFGLHTVFLFGLLILGCKREEPVQQTEQPAFVPPPIEQTNMVVAEPQVGAPAPGPVGAPAPAHVAAPTPVPADTAPAPTVQQPVPERAPGPTEYTVEPGDTFYSIGKKFGVSYLAIEAANPTVDPRRLKPGQKILIPAPSTATGAVSAAAPSAAPAAGQETIYVVKSGDTLSKIAKQFGVTVNAIRRANNLTTDMIKVGDKLRIPARPAESGAPAAAPQGGEVVPGRPSGGVQPTQGSAVVS